MLQAIVRPRARDLLVIACAFSASLCHAQTLNCTVSTTSVGIRPESLSEPVGDVLIKCDSAAGVPTGQAYLTAEVKVFINTTLVNPLGVAGGSGTTDAVLIINGNDATPTRESTLGGPKPTLPVPQYGEILQLNAVHWTNVRIPIPGARAADGTTFGRTTIRVTNLRVNPNQLGLSSVPGNQTIIALANQSIADASVPFEGVVTLATFSGTNSLKTSVSNPAMLAQCQSQNIVNGNVSGPPTFSVDFTEGFASAVRPLGQPTTELGGHLGEAGYPTPGLGANGGGATQGTRLAVSFQNVPNGTRLAVPARITQGALVLQLVSTDANGGGAYSPLGGSGLVEVNILTGFALAVYEVVSSDNTRVESASVPVTVGYTYDSSRNVPPPNIQSTVSAGYAPFSFVSTASSSAPLPRFVPGTPVRNAFLIARCLAAPTLLGLEPASIPAGLGTDLGVFVFGKGIVGSTVAFDGKIVDSSLFDLSTTIFAIIPASLLTTPGTVQVEIVGPDGQRSNKLPFTITSPVAPAIKSGRVSNAASGQATLAPGSLASVYGTSFSTGTDKALSFPLPTSILGTRVLVNGSPAPVLFVSPAQVNFQVPYNSSTSGTAQIVVSRNGTNSPAVSVPLEEFVPGIFRSDTQPIVLHADYSLVTAANPAKPSENLLAYGTGIGGLLNPPATGAAASSTQLSNARINPTISVGGINSLVQFAGLAPTFAGLAQFNFKMPSASASVPVQPLTVAFGDAKDTVNIAVSAPLPTGPLPVFTPGPLPANCATPAHVARFNNSTATIYSWVNFPNAKIGDRIEWTWYEHTGGTFTTSTTINFNGGGCAWSTIAVAGNANANKLGIWQSFYSYNGLAQSGNNFELVGGN